MTRRTSVARAVGIAAALAFATTVVATSGSGSPPAPFTLASCHGTTASTEKQCGHDLRLAIAALDPGDTLLIAAGTYEIGSIALDHITGTATDPIRVQAANPYRRPLLRGRVWVRSPRYLSLVNLRFEGRVPEKSPLDVSCGVGWALRGSEVFGSDYTHAYYTIGISGRQPGPPNPDDHGDVCRDEPRGFLITDNTFSRPYTDPSLAINPDPNIRRTSQYFHHVYASFEGSTLTGGRIERNAFLGMRNGAGIKLGDSYFRTLGPWNVRVALNTFYDGQRAVIIHDDARNNVIEGNLMVRLEGAGGACGPGIGVVYNDSDTAVRDDAAIRTNIVRHNYGYKIARMHGPSNDRTLAVTDGGDNGPLNAGTPADCPQAGPRADPRLDASLRPALPAAQAYGRYGSGVFG